ncbi:hypothetical protein [Chryseobacterium taeanense]|uniref:hypothetical protein n=1 Tax=Chryseobacterium taeanense TaxID=311334 RepID=UPI0035AEC2A2
MKKELMKHLWGFILYEENGIKTFNIAFYNSLLIMDLNSGAFQRKDIRLFKPTERGFPMQFFQIKRIVEKETALRKGQPHKFSSIL